MMGGCQPLAGEPIRWIKDNAFGMSMPHDAAARNRLSKIQKYVQQGGDVNKPNKLGDTALHEACAYIRDNGDTSKGKRRKAGVRERRRVGKKNGQEGQSGSPLEMLDFLIAAGAVINGKNIVGDAPLHKAALNGRAIAADFLIRHGADVNIRNEFAQTPLHAACVSGNIEVVQRLVQGGADTSAQDAAQDTPFHEACRRKYEGIVVYLMEEHSNPGTQQGLRLWQGLDPSWEKMLRARAMERIEEKKRDGTVRTIDQGPQGECKSLVPSLTLVQPKHNPDQQEAAGFGAGGDDGGGSMNAEGKGQCSLERAVSSLTEGSLSMQAHFKSAHSVDLVLANGDQKVAGNLSPVTVSMSPPSNLLEGEGSGEVPSGSRTPPTRQEADGKRDSPKKPRRHERRGRQEIRSNGDDGDRPSRAFSTGRSAALEWQATKVNNVRQGLLIEKAREALRAEKYEARAEAAKSSALHSVYNSCDHNVPSKSARATRTSNSWGGIQHQREEDWAATLTDVEDDCIIRSSNGYPVPLLRTNTEKVSLGRLRDHAQGRPVDCAGEGHGGGAALGSSGKGRKGSRLVLPAGRGEGHRQMRSAGSVLSRAAADVAGEGEEKSISRSGSRKVRERERERERARTKGRRNSWGNVDSAAKGSGGGEGGGTGVSTPSSLSVRNKHRMKGREFIRSREGSDCSALTNASGETSDGGLHRRRKSSGKSGEHSRSHSDGIKKDYSGRMPHSQRSSINSRGNQHHLNERKSKPTAATIAVTSFKANGVANMNSAVLTPRQSARTRAAEARATLSPLEVLSSSAKEGDAKHDARVSRVRDAVPVMPTPPSKLVAEVPWSVESVESIEQREESIRKESVPKVQEQAESSPHPRKKGPELPLPQKYVRGEKKREDMEGSSGAVRGGPRGGLTMDPTGGEGQGTWRKRLWGLGTEEVEVKTKGDMGGSGDLVGMGASMDVRREEEERLEIKGASIESIAARATVVEGDELTFFTDTDTEGEGDGEGEGEGDCGNDIVEAKGGGQVVKVIAKTKAVTNVAEKVSQLDEAHFPKVKIGKLSDSVASGQRFKEADGGSEKDAVAKGVAISEMRSSCVVEVETKDRKLEYKDKLERGIAHKELSQEQGEAELRDRPMHGTTVKPVPEGGRLGEGVKELAVSDMKVPGKTLETSIDGDECRPPESSLCLLRTTTIKAPEAWKYLKAQQLQAKMKDAKVSGTDGTEPPSPLPHGSQDEKVKGGAGDKAGHQSEVPSVKEAQGRLRQQSHLPQALRPRPLSFGRSQLVEGRPRSFAPISGGSAAWSKFLASEGGGQPAVGGGVSTPLSSNGDNAGCSMAKNVEGGVIDCDTNSEAGDAKAPETEAKDEDEENLKSGGEEETKRERRYSLGGLTGRGGSTQATVLKGFKEPVEASGPNKGPAGAFSGNAMWRLAGGASGASMHARAGVAANGHGGYVNPLAAQRHSVGGVGGFVNPLASTRGGGGGGGFVNPLSSKGGGGYVNPLALGRSGNGGNSASNSSSINGQTTGKGGSRLSFGSSATFDSSAAARVIRSKSDHEDSTKTLQSGGMYSASPSGRHSVAKENTWCFTDGEVAPMPPSTDGSDDDDDASNFPPKPVIELAQEEALAEEGQETHLLPGGALPKAMDLPMRRDLRPRSPFNSPVRTQLAAADEERARQLLQGSVADCESVYPMLVEVNPSTVYDPFSDFEGHEGVSDDGDLGSGSVGVGGRFSMGWGENVESEDSSKGWPFQPWSHSREGSGEEGGSGIKAAVSPSLDSRYEMGGMSPLQGTHPPPVPMGYMKSPIGGTSQLGGLPPRAQTLNNQAGRKSRSKPPLSSNDRDPGRIKVQNAVRAFQNTASRLPSSLAGTNEASEVGEVKEKGLVRLRRAVYSPRPC